MRSYLRILAVFASLGILAYSCSGTPTEETADGQEETKPQKPQTFEERARHEIEATLEIPVSEKYSMKIYREHLNTDGLEDAVITVNRMQFAQNTAIKSEKIAKMAEIGFTGYYNYIIYYDGGLDKFSVPIKIASSPGRELDIEFAEITAPGKMDFIVTYRILNGGFKNYYTVANEHDLKLMFQYDWYLEAGEADEKSYLHVLDYDRSPISKDIYIYESKIDNVSEMGKDIYAFNPKMTQQGKLVYHFFYDPRFSKYRAYPN